MFSMPFRTVLRLFRPEAPKRPLAHRHLNAAAGVGEDVLYYTLSAGMVLARRYLTGRGIDQAFADRYGSAYGRTAAKLYRDVHGAEPRKAWSKVSGKWRRVNGFLPAETTILDKAFDAYPRTRDYRPPADPVAVYRQATDGYAARFEELTFETLFALEDARRESCDAVRDHVEQLLVVLADWRAHLIELRQAAPGAYSAQESRAYEQALNATHEAWTLWNFRYVGGPALPESFALPPAAVPDDEHAACRLDGCDGLFHREGTCAATVAELPLGAKGSLNAELVAHEGEQPHMVLFSFDVGADETHARSTDPNVLLTQAARFRAFADAIEQGARRLAILNALEVAR